MRIFMAALATETNTFAPFPTGMGAFTEFGLVRDAASEANSPSAEILATFCRLAHSAGDDVVESLCAFAQPSGKTVRSVFERLRDQILDDLTRALAVGRPFASVEQARALQTTLSSAAK